MYHSEWKSIWYGNSSKASTDGLPFAEYYHEDIPKKNNTYS